MSDNSHSSHLFRFLFQLLMYAFSLGILLAALNNVFGNSIEVERMATAAACQGQAAPCGAQMTRWERTPIGQTFDMHTRRGSKVVRCEREYILVGPYTCTLREAPSGDAQVVDAEGPLVSPEPGTTASSKPPATAPARPKATAPAKPARAAPGR